MSITAHFIPINGDTVHFHTINFNTTQFDPIDFIHISHTLLLFNSVHYIDSIHFLHLHRFYSIPFISFTLSPCNSIQIIHSFIHINFFKRRLSNSLMNYICNYSSHIHSVPEYWLCCNFCPVHTNSYTELFCFYFRVSTLCVTLFSTILH